MENLASYISTVFILTSFLTVYFLFIAGNRSMNTVIILFSWMALQAAVGLSGFYTITDTFPPRVALLGVPALLFIIALFATTKGNAFLDGLDVKTLTLLHIIRIPVEIVLYWLFLNNAVPQLMTFEGTNFDIFAGLSAPFVYYFGFIKNKLSKTFIIAWNVVCLLLLINIIVNAVLSVPSVIQHQAFDQPNIAILYFPFLWLPSVVVPIVLLAHFTSIRQLIKKQAKEITI